MQKQPPTGPWHRNSVMERIEWHWRNHKEPILKGLNPKSKNLLGSKIGNLNSTDEKLVYFVLEKTKKWLSDYQRDNKTHCAWRFESWQWLGSKIHALHYCIHAKASKRLKWKLTIYQHCKINICWKHGYLLWQMGNVNKTQSFLVFWPTLQLRITMMLSVFADGRKLTPLIILNRQDVLQDKPPSGMVVKRDEKK